MSPTERRVLAMLGLRTFGLALGITAVTTYVPLLAQQFTSSTAVIGMVIAAEGLVALFVPVVAGAWSDQLRTSIGGRLPFLLLGAPAIGVTLALMSFMHSLAMLALVVFLFFVAYYAAYEPYRALYADLLRAEIAGRGQSTQAIFRGLASSGGSVLLLPPGTLPPKQGSFPQPAAGLGSSGGKVSSVFTVPPAARVVVVTPCSGKSGGSNQGKPAPAVPSGRGVLVAPPCSGSG